MANFDYNFVNAFWRYVYCYEAETAFAPRFTEDSFAKIGIGMNESNVIELVGVPLRKDCYKEATEFSECEWIYSWKVLPSSDNFDWRSVLFDSRSKVKEVKHDFFLN
ncbi:MAG: hypothetical protein GY866_37965 [Proteobacteria bacterium]|nr:hypothetical protein [Pseudomonadota bacterium]